MLKDITFGQYFPGNSVLHRLDPRVKIILTVIFITGVFLAQNIFAFGLIVAGTALLIAISRIPLKLILRGMKPLLLIIIFTAVINVFWTRGETPLVQFYFINIYFEGIMFALLMIVRITALLCNLASIAAMASLATVSGSALGIGLAGVYAFTAAMALPMETVMLPILAHNLAPAGSYEAVLGWFVSCNTAGYAVGIPLLNSCFDWFGSYAPMLFLFCGVMAVVTLTMQWIFRTVQKKQSLMAESFPPYK